MVKAIESPATSSVIADINSTPGSGPASLDVISIATLKSRKYLIELYAEAQNKYRVLEMIVSRYGASNVQDAIYSKIGDFLNVDLSFIVSGPNAILQSTNNEAFAVVVKVKLIA